MTVEQRTITVAQRINEDVVISSGIKPGETVVTEGQLRLEPGSRIQPPGARGDAAGAGRGGRGGGRRTKRAVTQDGRRELLGSLHPAADRHQPADGWRSRCSASSPIARCRSAICRTSTIPTLNVGAGLPGADPGHDGVGGRQPARAAVHDHRRPRRDDLVELCRQHQHHAAVRSRSRHRQRRGRRADARSPR